MKSVTVTIQERFTELDDKYNSLWAEMMAETNGDAKMSKIHDICFLTNEMCFLSGLQIVVMDERKEASDTIKMSLEIVNQCVSVIDQMLSKIPKGHIPSELFEKAYQIIKDYKNEHPAN